MKDGLCKEGNRLVLLSLGISIENDAINGRKNDSYDDYIRHIIRCKKCKEELGLSRNDIRDIRDDLKGRGKKK